MLFAIEGSAPSIQEAIGEFAGIAQFVSTLVAFATNVHGGRVAAHVAYDASPDKQEREFRQFARSAERGLVREGRLVNKALALNLLTPQIVEHPDWKRIGRAIGHYELALRDWVIGGEALCLMHLFIAAEALSKAAVRARCGALGLTEKELAEKSGIATDDPARPRWKDLLRAEMRREVLFCGDSAVHDAARDASDGLEHGFMDFSEIHDRARDVTLQTFRYIRRAILDLLEVPEPARTELAGIEPRDVLSLNRILHGVLTGPEPLAAPGQQYPQFEWTSEIPRVWWEGDDLKFTIRDRWHPLLGADVTFNATAYEFHGRQEEGRPFDAATLEMTVEVDNTSLD